MGSIGLLRQTVERRTQLSGLISGTAAVTRFESLEASYTNSIFYITYYNLFLFIDTFLCSPKEKVPKETAPCAPLLPACPERGRGALLKTGGALSNSAPEQQGPQTAKGPSSARFCDARRGTMGMNPLLALLFSPDFRLRMQGSDRGDLMTLRAV